VSTVRQLLKIIGRLEEERKMQRNTIIYYREEVEHLKAESERKQGLIDGLIKERDKATALIISRSEIIAEDEGRDAEVASLKSQLLRIKEKWEPFREFYRLTLSKLPDIDWVVRGARINTSAFRRLAEELDKVKDG